MRVVGLSLVAIFIVNILLDAFVSAKLKNSKGPLYISWNEIMSQSINADLIVIGNSRASWQYNTWILDSLLGISSYVLGFDGRGITHAITKYDIYNHFQNRRPKYLVVNIDYTSTLVNLHGSYREQLFPYMANSFFRKKILAVEPFNFAEIYIPVYRYTTYKGLWSLIQIESRLEDNIYHKGFTPYIQDWNGTEYEKLSTYHFSPYDQARDELDLFIAARREESVNVVLCYAPIYIGLTHKVDNLNYVYDCFNEIAHKHGVPILDYTFSDISRDMANFANATHLNKQGSELFTKELCNDLDSLFSDSSLPASIAPTNPF